MSPQCQQLQLMAFASESKQHSETPEDICAFVCRNDLRDPAICERQKKMKRVLFFVCQCSFAHFSLFLSSSFCSALYPCQQWCLHKDTDSHRHCLFVWHVGFSHHSKTDILGPKMTHILASVLFYLLIIIIIISFFFFFFCLLSRLSLKCIFNWQ